MWQRMSTANHPAEFYELPHEPLAQALQRFASAGVVGVGSGAAVSCWNEMVWVHCNSGKAEYVSVWKLLGPRASIPSVLDSRTFSRSCRCRSTKATLAHAGQR